MILHKKISNTREAIAELKKNNLKIGFVPTMGALHEGHISLILSAKEENDVVACSIFVNPIQFNNPEDLKKYPQTLDRDLEMLEEAGCHLVFAPNAQEMYPEPVKETFNFGSLETVMEGQFRPGHFNGVAVVVKKLFEIIEPDRAYFGEKDFQQLAIIQRLVINFKLPVQIVPCPIIREPDGLAMSSRNRRLTNEDRELAPLIYRILGEAKKRAKELTPEELKSWVIEKFNQFDKFDLEYFDIVDMATLQAVKDWSESQHPIACIAVWLGKIRLIDNIVIFS